MNDFDPNRIYIKLTTAGDEYADKEAAASLLEETKGTFLAQLMVKLDSSMSVAARETEAKADRAYEEHLRFMVEARKEANKAKVKYEAIKTWIDLQRTLEANKRAELKL